MTADPLQAIPQSATQRVVDVALTKKVPSQWKEARDRVASERAAVERWLVAGGRAYGFTTLLGHLDDRHMEWADTETTQILQSEMMKAHLIGRAMRVPIGTVRSGLILAAKIEQLHCGGSGVSPSSLDRYTRAVKRGRTLELPLALSYSCADVVPNAWVIHELFAGDDDLLAPGDLIALLGGHALPAAEAIPVTCALAYLTMHFNLRWSAVAATMRREAKVQLPVSLRDATPVRIESAAVVDAMLAASGHRLRTQAANPLFLFDEGGRVRDVSSTSRFLDFSLTAATERASTFLITLSHLTQRLVEHVVEMCDRWDYAGQHRRIQYPKVSRALSLRTRAAHQHTRGFLSDTSCGVEDLWDLSLISLHRLSLLQEALVQELLLLDELLAATPLVSALTPAGNALSDAAQMLSQSDLRLAPHDLERLILEVHPSWNF